MKKRMGALLLSFTLLCSLLLGGTIFGSAQETTSYSKEIIIPGNVDGWSGSTGGRTLGDTEVISYFNYSEDNNNYIKLNLWQLVQDNAPKGLYKVTVCYSTGDPSGTFVLNIRGKEHRLPITQTVEGYTSFQAGYMTTYEVFDFSEYNANDILLYNGAATANPDIRSIRLDYVADFTAYEWIEAEAADRITGEASIRDIQAASGAKAVVGMTNAAEPSSAVFSEALGNNLTAGAYRLVAAYMTGDPGRTLTVKINGAPAVLECPATTDDWNAFTVGYAETAVTLKGDGTDEIVFFEGEGAGGSWLDGFFLVPAALNKDITEIISPAALEVAYGTSFSDLELPEQVTAKLSDGTTASLAVTWSSTGYNGSAAGSYTLTGAVTPAGGVTNSGAKAASLTVTVKAKPADPDVNPGTPVLTLEAELPDEWGGQAGVRSMNGASGGQVLIALGYNADHSNFVTFNKALQPLKKGSYTVRFTYTSGDPESHFIMKVNGKEIPVAYTPTGSDAWNTFTPGTVSSASFTLKGDGTDEIMLYDGAATSSLWIDALAFYQAEDGPGGEENPETGAASHAAAAALLAVGACAVCGLLRRRIDRRS